MFDNRGQQDTSSLQDGGDAHAAGRTHGNQASLRLVFIENLGKRRHEAGTGGGESCGFKQKEKGGSKVSRYC